MCKIKVGYLVSYDYSLIKHSIPTLYDEADTITLAIDRNYTTWTGKKFNITDDFFEWIEKIDVQNKIQIYYDDFYIPEFTAIECDTRERNLLAKFMGEGGWHIQVDSDEYFLDFKKFVDHLKDIQIKDNRNICVYAQLITLFKKLDEGYLLIDSNEHFPLATNKPNYEYVRQTKYSERINLDIKVLHQSWARTENEVKQKLDSWGHTKDFNTTSYFNLWKAIDKHNFIYIKDFHPLYPYIWKKMELVRKDSIVDLIEEIKNSKIPESSLKKQKTMRRIYQSITPPIFQSLIKLMMKNS